MSFTITLIELNTVAGTVPTNPKLIHIINYSLQKRGKIPCCRTNRNKMAKYLQSPSGSMQL